MNMLWHGLEALLTVLIYVGVTLAVSMTFDLVRMAYRAIHHPND